MSASVASGLAIPQSREVDQLPKDGARVAGSLPPIRPCHHVTLPKAPPCQAWDGHGERPADARRVSPRPPGCCMSPLCWVLSAEHHEIQSPCIYSHNTELPAEPLY